MELKELFDSNFQSKDPKESAKNLGIRLTPGLLDITTSFQYGGGLLKFRNAPVKILLSFHHWSKETSQRLHRYKENDFFSFSQWKHREKLSKRSEISFFVTKTAVYMQRKGFGENMERRRKQRKKKNKTTKKTTWKNRHYT